MASQHGGALDLRADYLRKGFLGQVGFGRSPCLLVVDLTRGFTDPSSPLGSDLAQVIAANNELLDVARGRGIPVIFSIVRYDHPREAGLWLRKVPSLAILKTGSGMEDVDPRLAPRPDEQVLVKKFGSCFFGTALASQLTSQGIDTVIVTGVSTSGCVRATVVDAVQHGFRAIVPRQAVGDRAQVPHEANLFDMQAKYADVLELAQVKDYLQTVPR
jgi:nicotinamidase-related amidase